jgi:hypothetical protein
MICLKPGRFQWNKYRGVMVLKGYAVVCLVLTLNVLVWVVNVDAGVRSLRRAMRLTWSAYWRVLGKALGSVENSCEP